MNRFPSKPTQEQRDDGGTCTLSRSLRFELLTPRFNIPAAFRSRPRKSSPKLEILSVAGAAGWRGIQLLQELFLQRQKCSCPALIPHRAVWELWEGGIQLLNLYRPALGWNWANSLRFTFFRLHSKCLFLLIFPTGDRGSPTLSRLRDAQSCSEQARRFVSPWPARSFPL